jgi:Macrocin-O-methyltransferase (TylF)
VPPHARKGRKIWLPYRPLRLPAPVESPARAVGVEPRLQHLADLPVRYEGKREPSAFRFQNPVTYLFGGSDIAGWTYSERAAFHTEHDLEGRFRFMQNAAAYLFGSGIHGDYHEYGCYSANTFRTFLTWAAIYDLEIPNFWAFDSFQGLPAPDEGVSLESWQQGTMRMSEDDFRVVITAHGIFCERVHTVPGFYNESLTALLQQNLLDQEQRIAFVNVDCDLFASAVPVFEFIEPLLQEGSLIYLDDYFVGYRGSPKKGVAGAFWQFVNTGRWNVQEFQNVGAWGKSFIVYPK